MKRISNKVFKLKLHKDLKAHEEYKSRRKKILIECLRCGDKRKKLPSHLLNGKHRCIICGPKKTAKIKSNRFLKTLDNRLKKNNIKRKSEFLGKRKPLKLECLICGEVWTKQKGNTGISGCARCAQIALGLKNRLNESVVEKILNKKSIKLLSKYRGIDYPAKLKCLECSRKWSPSRLSETLYINNGCEICSKRFNGAYSMKLFQLKPHLKKENGKTYFLKCSDKKESFFKVGITKQKWRERLRKIPYKTKIIYFFKGRLPECVKLEIKIKKEFKKSRYRPNTYFAGVAECFKFKKRDIIKIKKILKN
jgi:hypothetical protein